MKIEIGESLLQSYLKNVKNCILTQTNWKTATSWKIKDEDFEKVEYVFNNIQNHRDFSDIFKKSSLEQALKQAELDVVGINEEKLYLVEVAFHENGLQYGDRLETKDRVCKKLLRAYLIGLAFFPNYKYEVIFSSPKVNPATDETIREYFSVLNKNFSDNEKVTFKYIANENFEKEILIPTIESTLSDSDSSELFLRSVKMLELFGLININNSDFIKPKYSSINHDIQIQKNTNAQQVIGGSIYNGLKVGEIAREILIPLLESGKVSDAVIEDLQKSTYSKQFFDIQYPLLKKVQNRYESKPERYYAKPRLINGNYYFVCSEWYEVPANNDRPYLIKWLERYMK